MACDDLYDAMRIVRDLAYGLGHGPACGMIDGYAQNMEDLEYFRKLQKKAKTLMKRKQFGCQEVLNRKPEKYIAALEQALHVAVDRLDREYNIPESLHKSLDDCNQAAADYYGNTAAQNW